MITKQVIDSIYKHFKSKPESPDQLNLAALFDYAMDNHGIYVDENDLVIDSLGEDSPFHTLPLDRIHGIAEFDRHIAIVLPSAIIFLNKKDSGVNIHIRTPKMSFMDKLRDTLNNTKHPDF